MILKYKKYENIEDVKEGRPITYRLVTLTQILGSILDTINPEHVHVLEAITSKKELDDFLEGLD